MEEHYADSEIGQLHNATLHRPSFSLKRLTPSNCQKSLFDDVLSVERAGEEHDIFANTLCQQGIEVLLLTGLLIQTLDIPEAKDQLLETQTPDCRLGPTFATDARTWLTEVSHRDLARHLSGGLTYSEIPVLIKNIVVDTHDIDDFITRPLPSHLFARDTSRWIYNGASINLIAGPARQRETGSLRAIYRWHPQLADDEFIKYFGDENVNYDYAMLEDGDVLVTGRGTMLIDMSEHTTPQGIELLAQVLFKYRQAERVTTVELPKHRSRMHLDTVMIHTDIDIFSAYPEIVRPDISCQTLTPNDHGGLKRAQESTLLHAIEKALGTDQVRLVIAGGDALKAERGQRNDANNVLTLRPGVVVGHECNAWADGKYDRAGITVLPILGDGLGRGRDGARCMSCPLYCDGI